MNRGICVYFAGRARTKEGGESNSQEFLWYYSDTLF